MKKAAALFFALLLLCACARADGYDYGGLSFPDYSELNPVRYLDKNERGSPYNGWQDMGSGEIRTVDVPMGESARYQFYSWYIRSDLQGLYGSVELPRRLAAMPRFLTGGTGHAILWRSMGKSPASVKLKKTARVKGENMEFIRAEYLLDGQQTAFVYLMEEDGVFSSCVFLTFDEDIVRTAADVIMQSWRKK